MLRHMSWAVKWPPMQVLPLLLGHRGTRVSPSFPENTLQGFDAALDQGCNGFEFDVRATADRELVIVHDPKCGRLTVARASRSDLPELPSLKEVLRKYGRRAFLDIELKVQWMEPAVLELLRAHTPVCGYVVSSFLAAVILELRVRRSALQLGIICDKPAQLRRAWDLPVDYMILEQSLVRRDVVQEVQAARRKLLVWTVNRPESMLRLADWGADGIISDNPALLAHTLSRERAETPKPQAKKIIRAAVKAGKRQGRKSGD